MYLSLHPTGLIFQSCQNRTSARHPSPCYRIFLSRLRIRRFLEAHQTTKDQPNDPPPNHTHPSHPTSRTRRRSSGHARPTLPINPPSIRSSLTLRKRIRHREPRPSSPTRRRHFRSRTPSLLRIRARDRPPGRARHRLRPKRQFRPASRRSLARVEPCNGDVDAGDIAVEARGGDVGESVAGAEGGDGVGAEEGEGVVCAGGGAGGEFLGGVADCLEGAVGEGGGVVGRGAVAAADGAEGGVEAAEAGGAGE